MDISVINNNRFEGWQRKLLDLTMRNVMLNLRTTRTIFALNEHSLETIVRLIQENRLAELVGADKEEHVAMLKTLHRESRNSLNENGANTLFVAVGTMRWYEKDSSDPRIAPLIFIPLEIIRRKAMTYEVKMLDEDPMLNVSLLEMLRRDFGVTIQELSPIPMMEHEPESEGDDDAGGAASEMSDDFPDCEKIFGILSEQVDAINEHQPDDRQWAIQMQSFIGLFSFKKFLMWHDINEHETLMRAHELLGNLSENRRLSDSEDMLSPIDVEARPALDLMLPIDYDSSQLVAIAEADRGTSFVLHGPPGTGSHRPSPT